MTTPRDRARTKYVSKLARRYMRRRRLSAGDARALAEMLAANAGYDLVVFRTPGWLKRDWIEAKSHPGRPDLVVMDLTALRSYIARAWAY